MVTFELSIIGSKTTIFTCCPILLVAFSFLFHEYHVHGSIIHNFCWDPCWAPPTSVGDDVHCVLTLSLLLVVVAVTAAAVVLAEEGTSPRDEPLGPGKALLAAAPLCSVVGARLGLPAHGTYMRSGWVRLTLRHFLAQASLVALKT